VQRRGEPEVIQRLQLGHLESGEILLQPGQIGVVASSLQ
jgi:hypothetical protein